MNINRKWDCTFPPRPATGMDVRTQRRTSSPLWAPIRCWWNPTSRWSFSWRNRQSAESPTIPGLFLANTAILDQREIDLIGQYVREGGRLLATFETSRFDTNGEERTEFGLAEVLGINYLSKTEFKTNYFRVPQGLLSEAVPPEWDILVLGPSNVVRASSEESFGELKIAFHDRGLTTHWSRPHNSPWKAVGPALVKHRHGRGQTIYVSFSPEAAYLGTYPLPEHRILVRDLVRLLSPPAPVSVEAPLTVGSVITMIRRTSVTLFI